jgi:hypothetical protein
MDEDQTSELAAIPPEASAGTPTEELVQGTDPESFEDFQGQLNDSKKVVSQHTHDLSKLTEILFAVVLVLLVAFVGILLTLGGFIYNSFVQNAQSYQNLADKVEESNARLYLLYETQERILNRGY